MPTYEYTGTDQTGRQLKTFVEADSIKGARQKLKKTGVVLITIQEKKINKQGSSFLQNLPGFNSVPLRVMALMTRQLSSLIKANIPLVEAITAVIEQTEHEALRSVLVDVRQQVNEGASLKQALGKHSNVFTSIFINMVESGEASGTLPLVLLRLADFMEAQVRLRNKIMSAMTYPILMLVVGGGLMLMIFTFVIPKIANIFVSMNKVLPWYTQALMDISFFIRNYWWLILIGIFVTLAAIKKYFSSEKGKIIKDRLMLRLPIFGDVIRMIAISRFSSTMATLLNGGVPLIKTLSIVKAVMNNEILAKAVVEARDNITEGQSVAGPLRRSGEFPPLLIHMVSIGERTGELPQMLEMVARSYEEQVNNKVERLTSLLEPMMILIMGASVGIIVVSVIFPLLDLQKLH